MGRAPEKGGRKENTSAGRSISSDIVRLIEMMTPWDQKSIPRILYVRGT